MSNLKTLADPFQLNDHDVRIAIDEHLQLWFCAEDVAISMEINIPDHIVLSTPSNWLMMMQVSTGPGDNDIAFITEPGLYQTVFHDDKQKAIVFSNWIMTKVIPDLRHNDLLTIA